jgi:proline iminopeptidase
MEQALALREDEPWYAAARAALERINKDEENAPDGDWDLWAHFSYGRWDKEIAEHARSSDEQINDEALPVYNTGAYDPGGTKQRLAGLSAPVLLLAGEYDLSPRPLLVVEAASCFPNARVVVQPRAGHFPWLDDAAQFVRLVTHR